MSDPASRILNTLSTCKRVLITTHVRPDGDALGTAAAMVLGLRHKKIESEVLLLSHLPTKYAFAFRDFGIQFHDVEAGFPDGYSLDKFDALLIVDTGTWSQLPGLQEQLKGFKKPKLVVDHHLTQEDWADEKLVRTTAAAAGEIAADLLRQWNVPLDQSIATVLFLAIASDTGWFQFSNTTPATLRLAADLMEAGVNTDSLYQHLYQNERPQRLALQTLAQQSLEIMADGRLAVMRVRKGDFDKTGAGVLDTENLINVPLQVKTVEVSIVLTEPKDNTAIRVSLRSKGSVDVARFAEKFGGGGHARASGLKVEASLQDAHDRVVAAMLQTLENTPKLP